MFSVGFSELVVIFVLVLVVFGPDKLPELFRNLGSLVGTLRKSGESVRREFYNAIYEPASEIKKGVTSAEAELRSISAGIRDYSKELPPECPDYQKSINRDSPITDQAQEQLDPHSDEIKKTEQS